MIHLLNLLKHSGTQMFMADGAYLSFYIYIKKKELKQIIGFNSGMLENGKDLIGMTYCKGAASEKICLKRD